MAAPEIKWFVSDYGGEQSSMSFPVPEINAATFDAQTVLIGNLRTAIDAIIVGVRTGHDYQVWSNKLGAIPNGSALAQRQIQFQVQYHVGADLNDTGTFTIPLADLSLLIGNTEYIDITAGDGLALKTAVEAMNEAAITVDAIKYISRNK